MQLPQGVPWGCECAKKVQLSSLIVDIGHFIRHVAISVPLGRMNFLTASTPPHRSAVSVGMGSIWSGICGGIRGIGSGICSTIFNTFNCSITYRIDDDNGATTTIFLDPTEPVTGTTPWRFNYLYFKAHIMSPQKPSWWPLNAHISFYYSYGKEKFKNISRLFYNQKNIQKYNSAKITNFKLVCCRGHFNLHWLVVKEHFVLKQFL